MKMNCLRRSKPWIILFVFAIINIAIYYASYVFLEKCSWFSDVLISLGAGFTTGLVIYILTNIRQNAMNQISDELEMLRELQVRAYEVERIIGKSSMECYPYTDAVKLTESCNAVFSEFNLLVKEVSLCKGKIIDELNLRHDKSQYDFFSTLDLYNGVAELYRADKYDKHDAEKALSFLKEMNNKVGDVIVNIKGVIEKRQKIKESYQRHSI